MTDTRGERAVTDLTDDEIHCLRRVVFCDLMHEDRRRLYNRQVQAWANKVDVEQIVGDSLVLTWLDALGSETRICTRYEGAVSIDSLSASMPSEDGHLRALRTSDMAGFRPIYETVKAIDLPQVLEDRLGVKIALTSCGPTHESKIWHGVQR